LDSLGGKDQKGVMLPALAADLTAATGRQAERASSLGWVCPFNEGAPRALIRAWRIEMVGRVPGRTLSRCCGQISRPVGGLLQLRFGDPDVTLGRGI